MSIPGQNLYLTRLVEQQRETISQLRRDIQLLSAGPNGKTLYHNEDTPSPSLFVHSNNVITTLGTTLAHIAPPALPEARVDNFTLNGPASSDIYNSNRDPGNQFGDKIENSHRSPVYHHQISSSSSGVNRESHRSNSVCSSPEEAEHSTASSMDPVNSVEIAKPFATLLSDYQISRLQSNLHALSLPIIGLFVQPGAKGKFHLHFVITLKVARPKHEDLWSIDKSFMDFLSLKNKARSLGKYYPQISNVPKLPDKSYFSSSSSNTFQNDHKAESRRLTIENFLQGLLNIVREFPNGPFSQCLIEFLSCDLHDPAISYNSTFANQPNSTQKVSSSKRLGQSLFGGHDSGFGRFFNKKSTNKQIPLNVGIEAGTTHGSGFKNRLISSSDGSVPVVPIFQVFGKSLEHAMSVSQVADGILVPSVVYRCIEYLDKHNAAKEEGIYRLSGSTATIRSLKAKFDRGGDVNLLQSDEYIDVHAVAGLLKLFFRELPGTILPKNCYPHFTKIQDISEASRRVNELRVVLDMLPRVNYAVLKALIKHLVTVVSNSDINKMTIRNISIVFAPTLGVPAGIFGHMLSDYDVVFTENQQQSVGILGNHDESLDATYLTPSALTSNEKRSTRLFGAPDQDPAMRLSKGEPNGRYNVAMIPPFNATKNVETISVGALGDDSLRNQNVTADLSHSHGVVGGLAQLSPTMSSVHPYDQLEIGAFVDAAELDPIVPTITDDEEYSRLVEFVAEHNPDGQGYKAPSLDYASHSTVVSPMKIDSTPVALITDKNTVLTAERFKESFFQSDSALSLNSNLGMEYGVSLDYSDCLPLVPNHTSTPFKALEGPLVHNDNRIREEGDSRVPSNFSSTSKIADDDNLLESDIYNLLESDISLLDQETLSLELDNLNDALATLQTIVLGQRGASLSSSNSVSRGPS